MGKSFKLFDWTNVTHTGAFSVVADNSQWDLSHLYTTGVVTLTAVARAWYAGFAHRGRVGAGMLPVAAPPQISVLRSANDDARNRRQDRLAAFAALLACLIHCSAVLGSRNAILPSRGTEPMRGGRNEPMRGGLKSAPRRRGLLEKRDRGRISVASGLPLNFFRRTVRRQYSDA